MELTELIHDLKSTLFFKCEYAKLLHKWMTKTFDLVRTNMNNQQQCQKELYDRKI